MDNLEKKPKRPRIGENRGAMSDSQDHSRYERVNYGKNNDSNAETTEGQRPYFRSHYNNRNQYNQNRQGGYGNQYGRQNGYNQGAYNRQGAYQHRPQRTEFAQGEDMSEENSAGNTLAAPADNGYQQRQQTPYNRGAYGNRQQGYNRQGGYNRQNGYNRQGQYNSNRQNGYGGQGSYNNRQQGGYGNNQNGYNNQGQYNNRQQGTYGNRQNQYNNQGRYGNRQQNPFPGKGKSFTPRPKPVEYETPVPDPDEQIRLNKFMANAGICSRREADEFIQQGLVKVNGKTVTELGTKIFHNDVVEYDEKIVALEKKCYILLNKPKDCVTTSDDPNGRLTVMDLVKGACNERIYPVGRLDRNTTGVLLLTNDGDLASKLTHPKYVKKKIYHVWCDKDISEDDMQRIADGIELEDGPIHADAISYATENDRNQAGIEIHSGRNRIVRRIFESLGYHVTKLDRVYFAGLTKKNLPRGRWRYLTQEEVNFLKMGSFE